MTTFKNLSSDIERRLVTSMSCFILNVNIYNNPCIHPRYFYIYYERKTFVYNRYHCFVLTKRTRGQPNPHIKTISHKTIRDIALELKMAPYNLFLTLKSYEVNIRSRHKIPKKYEMLDKILDVLKPEEISLRCYIFHSDENEKNTQVSIFSENENHGVKVIDLYENNYTYVKFTDNKCHYFVRIKYKNNEPNFYRDLFIHFINTAHEEKGLPPPF